MIRLLAIFIHNPKIVDNIVDEEIWFPLGISSPKNMLCLLIFTFSPPAATWPLEAWLRHWNPNLHDWNFIRKKTVARTYHVNTPMILFYYYFLLNVDITGGEIKQLFKDQVKPISFSFLPCFPKVNSPHKLYSPIYLP